MNRVKESIVLVEGYDDRAFWKGLLLRCGCKEAKKNPPADHRQQAGFTYQTPSNTLVHVIPYREGTSRENGSELQGIAKLAGRPDPHGKDHKAHAWSFYAGWSTDHGTGDFYASLWRDEPVAAALEDLLRAQGAWRVVEALLALPGSAAPLTSAPA